MRYIRPIMNNWAYAAPALRVNRWRLRKRAVWMQYALPLWIKYGHGRWGKK